MSSRISMKTTAACFLLPALLVWGIGCARTKPSKFYTLNAAWPESKDVSPQDRGTMLLGVGPVQVPTYMDRPQMVTRVNENEVALSEFNRWAEPVSKALPTVLENNLAYLLPGTDISGYNLHQHFQLTHQLVVEIDEFIGTPGGEAVLRVKWMLVELDQKDAYPLLYTGIYRKPTTQPGYEGLAAAMSALMREMAEDMVQRTPALQAVQAAQSKDPVR